MSHPNEPVDNGTRAIIDGKDCIHYDGYWIRFYAPPPETPAAKMRLVEHLARRLFHHAEPGINAPGNRVESAREAYERETDPARKRVNGAMLAGALFNRATDIFRGVLELEERGVAISSDNELMVQCGEHYREALELGRMVRHVSGEEGIDELWGEPFKAFSTPIEAFYASRYLKIAEAMRDIDRVASALDRALSSEPGFEPVRALVLTFATAAKEVSETIRRDPVLFTLWPRFVATGEALLAACASAERGSQPDDMLRQRDAAALARRGKDVLTWLSGARTGMPRSTREFTAACTAFRRFRSGD